MANFSTPPEPQEAPFPDPWPDTPESELVSLVDMGLWLTSIAFPPGTTPEMAARFLSAAYILLQDPKSRGYTKVLIPPGPLASKLYETMAASTAPPLIMFTSVTDFVVV